MKNPILKSLLSAAFVILIMTGCTKQDTGFKNNPEDYRANTLNEWLKLQLNLIKTTPGFAPPVAARALSYTHVAAYEAVVSGSNQYSSLVGQLNGLSTLPQPVPGKYYNLNVALSASMHSLLRSFYSNTSAANLNRIDSLFLAVKKAEAVFSDANTIQYSESYGKDLAEKVYAWSLNDGGKDGQLNNFPAYTIAVGPQYWVPGSPTEKPLLPFWGNNRAFVIANTTFALPTPLSFSTVTSSDIYKEHIEVYQVSKNLTADQRTIALFWADGGGTVTPGGHSLSIALQLAETKNLTLMKAAELYAKTSIAVADAFICCWKTKYTYNTPRPISYIKSYIDASWNPLIPTPPFPEHSSGHSSQSGAAVGILTSVFGAVPFTDHTHDAAGFAPRSFSNFEAFGNEAMNSRMYGGIHIKRGNESGLQMGKQIAENVLKLKFRK